MFGFLAIVFRVVIGFCITVIIRFSLTVSVTVRTLFSIWNAVERCDLISMTKEGFYDPKMMRLLKKIRCELNPTNYECSMTSE